jgi:hypothetical protein
MASMSATTIESALAAVGNLLAADRAPVDVGAEWVARQNGSQLIQQAVGHVRQHRR